MKLKYMNLLLAVAFMAAACTDFLSELPTKGTNQPITTIEQLNGLLDGLSSAQGSWQENSITMAYATDDSHIPIDFYDAYPVRVSVPNLYYYTFNIEDIPNEAVDGLWGGQFSLIYRANLILANVDKVSGDPDVKERVKAEAYFLRAYCYWVLANYYCLPYAPAHMEEQGVPKKISISDEENYSHMTLRETYELIDADIEEALKIDVEDSQNSWRADKATIHAFLSRYYMYRGEYDKAITAANYALEHKGTTKLRDYNTLVAGIPEYYVNPLDTIFHSEIENYTTPQIVNWEEIFYLRWAYIGSQWMIPSPELLALYDQQNDMRFKWFMHPKGNRRFSVTDMHVWRYSMFSDGRYAWSGPTIQEVMLNKAECLVRKTNPDIAGALALVNELRVHRIASGTPDLHLTALGVDEALIKILQERRRELPFGHRWWDIRRFSVTETTVDKVAITRVFHPVSKGAADRTQTVTYTLPVGSRRYAVPINGVEIDASQGILKQNTY